MTTIPKRRRNLRYWRNLILVALSAMVVGYYIIMPIFIAYSLVHRRAPVCCYSPADWGLAYEDVRLTTADGITLAGWYIPSENGAAVITLHGSNGNRTRVLNHAAMLAAQGYGVLMIDVRGHGDSGGELFTMGWDADPDVDAAVAYLQSRDDVNPERIGILGLSMGGQIALQGAARNQQVQAVVSDGAGARTYDDYLLADAPGAWLQAPFMWVQYTAHGVFAQVTPPPPMVELLPQIAPRPILFIFSGHGNPGERFLTVKYAEAAGENAAVWEIPEAGHTGGLSSRPAEYRQRISDFFGRALLDS